MQVVVICQLFFVNNCHEISINKEIKRHLRMFFTICIRQNIAIETVILLYVSQSLS